MKTSFIRTATDDNLELHGLLYEPETKGKVAVASVHGMAGNFYENEWIDYLAKGLTAQNIAFAPMNNRGNGNITIMMRHVDGKTEYPILGNTFEVFEECVHDIKAHIDYLEQQGYTEIHLAGHSLGAPKVAYYLNQIKDPRIKSIIFLAPADMIGLAKQDKAEYDELHAMAISMTERGQENEIMPKFFWSENPFTPKSFLSLFDDDSKTNIFNWHNQEDPWQVMNEITIPTLTCFGDKDAILLVPIEETMEKIKHNMKQSPRSETEIIEGGNHQFKGQEDVLVEKVVAWIGGE